jgi:cellulose synthase/poly-beta-1,6-N-acetylglucosamine synthase-like glycosyltransferase
MNVESRMPILDILAWLITGILLIPLSVLVLESLLALLPARKGRRGSREVRPRCTVLMPAHNEEAGIAKAVLALLPQLDPADRLVVVADNCTDRTADVAHSLGATVVERQDPGRRSKMFALDYGVRSLEHDPPDVVVVVDADCLVPPGGLGRLVREAVNSDRPVQAAYVMAEPQGASPRDRISAFAFRYKNVVRPLGLARLGLPCLLTGTGMAFPWAILRAAPLAHSKLADDFNVSVDLTLAGHAPKFCQDVQVISELPPSGRAAYGQRKRWEQGHIQCLLSAVPRLLWGALRQRRLDLAGLALELSVPPLSMLFLFWAGAVCALLFSWQAGGSALPAAVLGGWGWGTLCAILASWMKFGRRQLPFTQILAVPLYVIWKLPIYLSLPFRPQRAWLRTERKTSSQLGG